LQPIDQRHFLRIVGVETLNADRYHHMLRVGWQAVRPDAVKYGGGVMVVVDDQQRYCNGPSGPPAA